MRKLSVLATSLLSAVQAGVFQDQDFEGKGPTTTEKVLYDNYSFDLSAHDRPMAYVALGNALEHNSRVKLNPAVEDRGGAYVFDSQLRDKNF